MLISSKCEFCHCFGAHWLIDDLKTNILILTRKKLWFWFYGDFKLNALLWPSQSPDLNIIENVWIDLKRTMRARRPRNITELEDCKEEWAKSESWLATKSVYRLWYLPKGGLLGTDYAGCPNFCCGDFSFSVILKILNMKKKMCLKYKGNVSSVTYAFWRSFHILLV